MSKYIIFWKEIRMSIKKLSLLSLIFTSSIFASSIIDDPLYEVDLGSSVIYSSTGFETEVRDVASNPTIVVSEEIEQKRYTTLEEILSSISAITVQQQMGMPIIDMRGQGSKATTNVQLLVDGIRANVTDTSHMGTPVNTIAVSQIERVEVIPGGGAVLYGSGTSGGVINVITKKQTGPRATAGYRYGSYQNKIYEVSAGHTLGNLDIDLSYTKTEGNGYRKYSTDESDYFHGKLRYDINEDHSITFRYTRYESDSEIPGSLSRIQLRENRRQSGLNPGNINEWNRTKDEFALEYLGKISDNLELSLLGYYQDTDMHYTSVSPGAATTMVTNAAFDDWKKGATAKLKYTYGRDDSNIIVGIEYLENELNRVMNMHGIMHMAGDRRVDMNGLDMKSVKESISGFVLNTYKYNDWEFIQGFRYEKADYTMSRKNFGSTVNLDGSVKKQDNFALELAVNYLYSDTGNVYLKYERGFTSPAPALITNRYATTHPDPTKAGIYYYNDLDSETYNLVELGFRDTIGDNASVSGAIYYNLMSDEIRSSGHASNTQHSIENINLDKTRRYGLELSSQQYLGKFTFTESYNYVNASIKSANDNGISYSGKKIAGVPNHKLSLGVMYAYNDRFNIGGDVVYNSAYYLNNRNIGGKQNSYATVNLRANFRATNNLDIYAGVNNVLDKEYYSYVSYSTSTGEYSYDPADKRNYYVGFKFQF